LSSASRVEIVDSRSSSLAEIRGVTGAETEASGETEGPSGQEACEKAKTDEAKRARKAPALRD
jgi:hypothetical protein